VIAVVALAVLAGASALADPSLPVDLPVPPPGAPPNQAPAQDSSQTAVGSELIGLFRIKKGECAGGGVTTGTHFRMFDPGGGLVTNGSSPCGDRTFTPLTPGTDGGLSTSGYQPHPEPAFDGTGNGLNNKITQPEAFYGTRFSTATNSKDPQTGATVAVPRLTADGPKLGGDLRAFAAAWQTQHFNQGAPKPDGSTPGATAAPAGTLNPATGAFSVDWKSHIVGGPFNNFTGQWHFEGTFQSGVIAASQGGQTSVGGASTRSRRTSGTLASTGMSIPQTAGVVLVLLSISLIAVERRTSRRNR
jgi:hypothetical protein